MGRNKETMKRVLKFISPYKAKIIIMLLTALVTVGFTLYTPILIGNGVDNIVFTAGIGENAIPVREKVVSYLGYLGVTLDKEANGVRGEEIVISTPDSKVKVAVIPTNEELAICRETVALV